MFILPVVRDHLSWETTKFSGRFMQVLDISNFIDVCRTNPIQV